MMIVENFEKIRTLVRIAFKKALVEDSPLHHNLMKHAIKDIDEVFIRAKKYIRLESIHNKKPSTSVATVSIVLMKVQEPWTNDNPRLRQSKKN